MFVRTKNNDLNKILQQVNDFEAKGKTKQVISGLQEAIKLNPKDGNLYNRLGDFYIRSNRTKEAIFVYRKGVEAYKNDTFSRNAIALCKKILRYDPDNIDIYSTIAELLVELDEKSNALPYLFDYIEKRRAQENIDEVLKTLEYVEKLEIADAKWLERINDTYRAIGRDDLVKKRTAEEVSGHEDIEEREGSVKPASTQETKQADSIEKDVPPYEEQLAAFDKEEKKLKDNITHLDNSVKNIEQTISQLRNAVRIDEVVSALDTSLNTFSDEQKKAIALLQRSLTNNLDKWQDVITNLHTNSDKKMKDLEGALNNLNKALANLSKNQISLPKKIDESIGKLSDSINSTTKDASQEIKSVLSDYKKATDEMYSMFSEAKDCNMSLVQISEVMKCTIQQMNDSLTAFTTTQILKSKKQGRFALIIVALTAAMSILLFFLVIR